MKFQYIVFFALATLLAVGSAEKETDLAVYEAQGNTVNEGNSELQDYELQKETDEPITKNYSQSTELEPYRICLVVRCFPRNSKLQICWCVKWK